MAIRPRLIRDENHLMDFVDTAAIGLHWVAADGAILWANRADYEPLGYTADEYIGHNITEFHASADTIADILQKLTCGERIEEYEARLRCKDGSIRDVAITSSALFEHEQFVHTRCFTRDITRQRHAEQQLEAKLRELTREIEHRERIEAELRIANAAKDEFLSIASHELRTPLQALKLNTESFLRAKELVTDDRLRNRLVKMDRQASRLIERVTMLLDVSRLASGTLDLVSSALDLSELTRQVVQRYDDEGRATGSVIGVAAPAPVVGRWDRGRIEQVVGNLLGNALKYGSGKPIDVVVSATGSTATLVVRDRGIGIAAEDRARIFQRFERAVSANHYSGFGVGLWIVSQLVAVHRGTVAVDSAPGDGATFTIELPPRMTTTPQTILLVDDDFDLRDTLRDLLESEGYVVDLAENGAIALERLRTGSSPSMILLDLMMPVMDGYRFCEERAKDASLAAVPVVVFSAGESARPGNPPRPLLGVSEILRKPTNLETLLDVIARNCMRRAG